MECTIKRDGTVYLFVLSVNITNRLIVGNIQAKQNIHFCSCYKFFPCELSAIFHCIWISIKGKHLCCFIVLSFFMRIQN